MMLEAEFRHLRSTNSSVNSPGRVIVGNGLWRDFYLKNPGECDKWLKANAVLGSILAIAMLAMAVVGHYSAGPNGATEISAVQRSSK
jgi:hypothetical protein